MASTVLLALDSVASTVLLALVFKVSVDSKVSVDRSELASMDSVMPLANVPLALTLDSVPLALVVPLVSSVVLLVHLLPILADSTPLTLPQSVESVAKTPHLLVASVVTLSVVSTP